MKALYNMKYDLFPFDGIWLDVFGTPEKDGAWMIWGSEKNGKTWMALLLSNYFSTFAKLLFVSGEEGLGSNFQASCKRANISPQNARFVPSGYLTIDELYALLKRRNAPKVVVLDNITIYNDELKNGALRKLIIDFPSVLFIFLAHEDRGEPYTATAKLCKRLAKVIIYVEGLACSVSGRCPGGRISIDEERSALYHGENGFKKIGAI